MLLLPGAVASPTLSIHGTTNSRSPVWSPLSPKVMSNTLPLRRRVSQITEAKYTSPIALPKRYVLDIKAAPTETLMSCIVYAVDVTNMQPVILKINYDNSAAEKELQICEYLLSNKVPYVAQMLDSFVVDSMAKPSNPHEILPGKFTVLVFPRYTRILSRIDLVLIRKYMQQLAISLTTLHRLGIWHMDVTLSNLMVASETGDLVLIDFGLAVNFNSEQHKKVRACGTSGYIDPELGSVGAIPSASDINSGYSDVYSAGCVFGQWMHPFLSKCNLNLLGARNGGSSISEKALELLSEQLRIAHSLNWTESLVFAAQLLRDMLQNSWSSRISSIGVLNHSFLTDESFENTTLDEWARKSQAKALIQTPSKCSAPVSPVSDDRCKSSVFSEQHSIRRQQIYVTYR